MPEDFDFERGVQMVDGNSDRAWLEQKDTTFIDEYNLDRVNNTGTPRVLCELGRKYFNISSHPKCCNHCRAYGTTEHQRD